MKSIIDSYICRIIHLLFYYLWKLVKHKYFEIDRFVDDIFFEIRAIYSTETK